MSHTVIAFPSHHPGGLQAALADHFGHCELYTLVSVEQDQIHSVGLLPNVPHEQGGCMAPVQHLYQHGVQFLIAGGMGLRPLMGFNQVGIQVFHRGQAQTVQEAVDAYLQGKLTQFSDQHTCGGGGGQAGMMAPAHGR